MSGLSADLREAKGVTILAPTDDAFTRRISERAFEELVLVRKDELRTLLKSHLVDRSLSLSDLVDAGNVTTLAGTSVTVSRRDGVIRIADRAETVCGDYQVANGRIHIAPGTSYVTRTNSRMAAEQTVPHNTLPVSQTPRHSASIDNTP